MDFLDEIFNAPRTCTCDLCTGKKKYADNWCARCGDVRLVPPKRWENEDVCDECERQMAAGEGADATPKVTP